jgi:hypothetical protein
MSVRVGNETGSPQLGQYSAVDGTLLEHSLQMIATRADLTVRRRWTIDGRWSPVHKPAEHLGTNRGL